MYGSPYEFDLALSGANLIPSSHAAYQLPSQVQQRSRRQAHPASRRHQPSLHLINEQDQLPYLAYSNFTTPCPSSVHEQSQYRARRVISRDPFPASPTRHTQHFDRHSWDPAKRWAAHNDQESEPKRHTYYDIPPSLRAGPPTVYHEMSADYSPHSAHPSSSNAEAPQKRHLPKILPSILTAGHNSHNSMEPIVSPLNHSVSGASRHSTISPLSTQPSQRVHTVLSRQPLPSAQPITPDDKSSEPSPSPTKPKTPGMLTAGRFIASCRELRPSTSVLAEYEIRFGSTATGNSPIREVTTIVLNSPKLITPAEKPKHSRRQRMLNLLRRLRGRRPKV